MGSFDVLQRLGELCSGIGGDGTVLPVALLVAGLASGFSHCAGMCGPFVLGQVARAAGRSPAAATALGRLRVATLVPYHLGRATTYGVLGAAAGGAGGALGLAWAGPLLLAAAAVLLLAQAWGWRGVPGRPTDTLARALGRLTRPLAGGGPLAGYALGGLLGFLPCGVLYAAITAAGAAGGAWHGALALLAFAAGTVPGLVVVAYAGHALAARAGSALRYAAVALLLLNAATLGAIAWAGTT